MKISKKKFLINAVEYSREQGKEVYFLELYGEHRKTRDIEMSTWLAISHIFGLDKAWELEDKSLLPFI